jgi:hemoglobin
MDTAAPSLYIRLGGYDVIAAFVDAWLRLLVLDRHLGGYFKGMSVDTQRKVRQLTVDFVAAHAGGPVLYTGRSMKVAHEGLGISERDYELLMQHAATALYKVGVPEREKREMVSFLASFKKDCVER